MNRTRWLEAVVVEDDNMMHANTQYGLILKEDEEKHWL